MSGRTLSALPSPRERSEWRGGVGGGGPGISHSHQSDIVYA